jgi:hypothetical protein
MASVRQVQVTFDCAEPERVARFWCEVLGYVVPPPPQGFATWGDFDRALVRLLRADGVNESCLVMQDIEGNEFCLD